MAKEIIALVSGLLAGLGLVVSQMINPQKMLGFLDIFGEWDPSLAFVMGGALLVTAVGYRLTTTSERPVFAEKFHMPTNTTVDAKLAVGSVLFGIGWGISGLCPGPAISALTFGGVPVVVFVLSMLAGSWIYKISTR